MKRAPGSRMALFAALFVSGVLYILWFAYLVRHSEDYVVRARREAVCAGAAVPVDQDIAFAADADRNMLASGWSAPDEWGVWSAERRAVLILPTPARTAGNAVLELDLLAPTNPRFPLATVDVAVGGRHLAQWQLRDDVNREGSHTVIIPADLIGERSCVMLELYFANAYRPVRHGLGEDRRLLGIGLKKARWRTQAGPP